MKVLIREKISPHKFKTPEGYLICQDSILARTGKQTYRKNELFLDTNDDSEIEVDRPYDEVFSKETLASFENKPITIEHPDEDVTIDNYKDYAVGFVRDIRQGKTENGEDVIIGNLVITDKQAIEEIEAGQHTDLSCGYDCDIVDEENPRQTHIRGNHVALCEQGRAGISKIIDSVKDAPNKSDLKVWASAVLKASSERELENIVYEVANYDKALFGKLYKELKGGGSVQYRAKNISDILYWNMQDSIDDAQPIKIPERQIKSLKEYGNHYEYEWDEIEQGIKYRILKLKMSMEEAIEDIKDDMVSMKSSLLDSIKDESYPNRRGKKIHWDNRGLYGRILSDNDILTNKTTIEETSTGKVYFISTRLMEKAIASGEAKIFDSTHDDSVKDGNSREEVVKVDGDFKITKVWWKSLDAGYKVYYKNELVDDECDNMSEALARVKEEKRELEIQKRNGRDSIGDAPKLTGRVRNNRDYNDEIYAQIELEINAGKLKTKEQVWRRVSELENRKGINYNGDIIDDLQRVGGYLLDSIRDATEKTYTIYLSNYFGTYKIVEWQATSKEEAVKEFLEKNPSYKKMGTISARDSIGDSKLKDGIWCYPKTEEQVKKWNQIISRQWKKSEIDKLKNELYGVYGDDEFFDDLEDWADSDVGNDGTLQRVLKGWSPYLKKVMKANDVPENLIRKIKDSDDSTEKLYKVNGVFVSAIHPIDAVRKCRDAKNFYAKEVNGKGYVYNKDNDRIPIGVETSYEKAKRVAEMLNESYEADIKWHTMTPEEQAQWRKNFREKYKNISGHEIDRIGDAGTLYKSDIDNMIKRFQKAGYSEAKKILEEEIIPNTSYSNNGIQNLYSQLEKKKGRDSIHDEMLENYKGVKIYEFKGHPTFEYIENYKKKRVSFKTLEGAKKTIDEYLQDKNKKLGDSVKVGDLSETKNLQTYLRSISKLYHPNDMGIEKLTDYCKTAGIPCSIIKVKGWDQIGSTNEYVKKYLAEVELEGKTKHVLFEIYADMPEFKTKEINAYLTH